MKLTPSQQATYEGIMHLIEDYIRHRQARINGPNPGLDATERMLEIVIKSLIKEAPSETH